MTFSFRPAVQSEFEFLVPMRHNLVSSGLPETHWPGLVQGKSHIFQSGHPHRLLISAFSNTGELLCIFWLEHTPVHSERHLHLLSAPAIWGKSVQVFTAFTSWLKENHGAMTLTATPPPGNTLAVRALIRGGMTYKGTRLEMQIR